MINSIYRPSTIAVTCALFLTIIACGDKGPTGSDSQVPTSISVSTSLLYLKIGETAVVTVEVLDQNDKPITEAELSWSSSNIEVASISNDGVITALSFGKAEISVRSGLRSTVIQVFVSNDLEALVVFYTALNGPFWRNNSNWLSTRPLDEWYGLTINAEGHVEQLDLENNGLKGELPPQLGDLEKLQSLNLRKNSINGDIPHELGRLSELQVLTLSENAITGSIPSSIGDLRNLESFSIFGNGLSGEIPSSLGNLSNLWYLTLDDNRLSGDIPPSIGYMGNLRQLSFRNNELSGEIPATLGRLANLSYLNLSNNRLAGNLPPQLANLSRLTRLFLSNNGLNGEIPPQFGNFAVLERLFLASNSLTGSVPPELGRLNSLWQLNLNNNPLMMGPLPLELVNLTNLSALWLTGTGLCAPADPEFLAWLEVVGQHSGLQGVEICSGI